MAPSPTPRTVAEAAELLYREWSQLQRDRIQRTSESQLHGEFEPVVRNRFDLHNEDSPIVIDAKRANWYLTSDEISRQIMEAAKEFAR